MPASRRKYRIARLIFIIAVGFSAARCETADAAEPLPQWFGPRRFNITRWIAERTFPRSREFANIQQARLRFAADFCGAVVDLNGAILLRVEPYCQTQDLDVTEAVQRGLQIQVIDVTDPPKQKLDEHLLRITVYQAFGPAATALTLTVIDDQGATHAFRTDDSWKVRPNLVVEEPFDVGVLGFVRPELWGVGRRDASVSPLENYEQWRQASVGGGAPTQRFYMPDGFEASLVRMAAPDEGSWIALGFDPRGRALISREDRGFLRLSFDDEHAEVTRTERIASDLKECRGLLYAYDRWYANANNSKGMHSLRITDDGRIVDQKLLREFPGGVGHGRNDLALGKDGRIYSIHGDSVELPGPPVRDRTSPLDRRQAGGKSDQASVVSTDADGKTWELYCRGLRNPYGLAVAPDGDLFTYDADNEFDMGTPWYRPTRIVQLRSGSDYGYRITRDNRRPNYVDDAKNARPLITVGRGSPTACMFGTELKFPQPYRNALFALDWTYGRVLAVHLAPRGAGYRANLETFVQGRPLNVTDIAAGPDGAMYLVTGGRKTQSALYRVAYVGTAPPPPAVSEHERDVAEYSRKQRAVLAEIERMHGMFNAPTESSPTLATERLKAYLPAAGLAMRYIHDPDPALHYAARVLLEQAPSEFWRIRSSLPAEGRGDRPFQPPYAYELAAPTAELPEMGRQILSRFTRQQDVFFKPDVEWIPFLSRRIVLLDLIRRAEAAAGELAAPLRDDLFHKWERRFTGDDSGGYTVSPYGDSLTFRRSLAAALVAWDDPSDPQFTETAARSLLTSNVQEDRLAGLEILSHVRRGWTPETRRLYFTALRDGRRFVGGQGMPGFLDQIKTDAVATLSDAEKADVADLLTPPKDDDEPLPPQRPLVRKWTLDELSKLVATDDSAAAALRGDPAKGAVVFREALCSRCHRAGAVGPAVGPDLSFVAARFSRRDILHSVLQPSAAVAEQYRNSEITTDDGRTLTGRVVSEGDYRSEKLLINTDPLRPSRVMEVDKKQIAEHRLLGASPMPEGLLDGFTAAEIRDLLAFLEAGTAR